MATKRRNEAPPTVQEPAEPLHVSPMFATASEQLPSGRGYGFEFKWDGYRSILHVQNGRVRVDSRRLNDVTSKFPTVAAGGERVRENHLVLDGEIVALDENNHPSFGLLQQHLRAPGAGPKLARAPPIVFFAFDVLYRNGKPLLQKTYEERRKVLDDIDLSRTGWRVPPYEVDQGPAMVSVSETLRLEGVVAKKLDSVYRPGIR